MSIAFSPVAEVSPQRSVARRLVRFALGFAFAYVLVVVVLMWFENHLLYHPASAESSWVPPRDPRIEDVWLEAPSGRIHAWWCPVDSPKWFVLYCHGNAGNLSHRQGNVACIQKNLNASVLIFGYPGYGRSGGSPSEAGCYQAAHASYQWLMEKAGSAERIVLLGISLGAAVALDVAVREPCAALLMLSPFRSVPAMAQRMFPFLPARWLCRNRFDNEAKLPHYSGPVFIGHGDADATIPQSHGQRLFEIAPGPAKRFLVLPGCDHNNAACDQFFIEAGRFLDEIGR